MVGFKYGGWGLLHRPKDGSLLQLRTLFVHFKPDGQVGLAASAAYRDFLCQPKFSGSSIVTSKHLVGFKHVGWGLLHRPKDGSLLQLRTLFVHLSQTTSLGPPPAPPVGVFDATQSFQGRV